MVQTKVYSDAANIEIEALKGDLPVHVEEVRTDSDVQHQTRVPLECNIRSDAEISPQVDDYFLVVYFSARSRRRTFVGRISSVNLIEKTAAMQFYRRTHTLSTLASDRFAIRHGDVDNAVPFAALIRRMELKETAPRYVTFTSMEDLTE